ncbi:MAG: hypothetical protein AB9869_04745 [Verrucomicrobiia bacterium]
MCVILVCPKDRRPDLNTLQLCHEANPHGAGIAWRDGGAVEWLKTNDVETIHDLAHLLRGEIVIHFRIASVGGVCDALRHPFPCTGKASLKDRGRTGAVLFHNGTWTSYREALIRENSIGHRPPVGEMSDSRAAAWLCHLHGHEYLERIGGWSRFVYFAAHETVLYGDWKESGGIRFSNLNWQPFVEHDEPPPHLARRRPGKPTLVEDPLDAFEDDDTPDVIPGDTPKSEEPRERELWDLTGVDDYWAKLSKKRFAC